MNRLGASSYTWLLVSTRIGVPVLGVVVVATSYGAQQWVIRLSRGIDPIASFAIWTSPLWLVVAFVALLWLVHRRIVRDGQPPLRVSRVGEVPTLIAPASPVATGILAATLTFVAANEVATTFRLSITDNSLDPTPFWFFTAVVGGLLVLAAVRLLAAGPRVTLTADEISVRGLFGRHTFPWTALSGEHPPSYTPGRLSLYLATPTAVVTHGVARRRPNEINIRTDWLEVRPEVLAYTIRHYLDHPQALPSIGTADPAQPSERPHAP